MKKTIFILLLTLPSCIFCQNVINGIGKLRLGISESQLREFVDSDNIKETKDSKYITYTTEIE